MKMSLKLVKVKQKFRVDKIPDIKAAVEKEIKKCGIKIGKGERIAIAVGSRGIANLRVMVKKLINIVKTAGAKVFIVPAMGSHGGATAKGQCEILASLGITAKNLNVPVKSSMEVVELPSRGLMNRLFMDKYAYHSDGVILINRVKPHTDYICPYESGLCKMSVIGLGNHLQALEIHRFGVKGLKEYIPASAKKIFSMGKIILGLAVVENALDETCIIKALKPEDILNREPGLLKEAYRNMPSLPVGKIDILIVDRLGKNISGTGMDPNIIGRLKIYGMAEPVKPDIKKIIVTDLTPESHGNALGIGFADLITERLYGKINISNTYENVITSNFLERGKIPLVAKSVQEAFDIARRAAGPLQSDKERIVRIKDTLNLEEVYVSEAIYKEIKEEVVVLGDPVDTFDSVGELLPF